MRPHRNDAIIYSRLTLPVPPGSAWFFLTQLVSLPTSEAYWILPKLIGGLEHEFYFSTIGNVIIPTDELIFLEGAETTNQIGWDHLAMTSRGRGPPKTPCTASRSAVFPKPSLAKNQRTTRPANYTSACSWCFACRIVIWACIIFCYACIINIGPAELLLFGDQCRLYSRGPIGQSGMQTQTQTSSLLPLLSGMATIYWHAVSSASWCLTKTKEGFRKTALLRRASIESSAWPTAYWIQRCSRWLIYGGCPCGPFGGGLAAC